MKLMILVGIGGALGTMVRFGIATLMNNPGPNSGLPLATLTVNLLGCFLIGLVASLLPPEPQHSEQWRLLIVVGVLGGFTTFSSFGLETLDLLTRGEMRLAALYVIISNVGGIAAAWLGRLLSTNF